MTSFYQSQCSSFRPRLVVSDSLHISEKSNHPRNHSCSGYKLPLFFTQMNTDHWTALFPVVENRDNVNRTPSQGVPSYMQGCISWMFVPNMCNAQPLLNRHLPWQGSAVHLNFATRRTGAILLCTMCTLCSLSSLKPNQLGHILNLCLDTPFNITYT